MEARELDPQRPKEEAGAVVEVAVPDGVREAGDLEMMPLKLLSAILPRNFKEIAVIARKRVTKRPTVIPRNGMKPVSQTMLLQHLLGSSKGTAIIAV